MPKKIYITKEGAKELEFSDSEEVPYKEKPEPGFNYEITFNECSLEFGEDCLLQDGYYQSANDQDKESTLETLKEVKIKGSKKNKKTLVSKIESEKPKIKKTLTNKLEIEDFFNPMFDIHKPSHRKVPARKEVYDTVRDSDEYQREVDNRNANYEEEMIMNPESDIAMENYMFGAESEPLKEPAIEGRTFTDNFKGIGFTYFKLDGMLHISYLDKEKGEGVKVFEDVINSSEEFYKAVKKADREITKYLKKK